MKIHNIRLTKIESAVPATATKSAPAEMFPWPEEINTILEACRKSSYMLINDHNRKAELMRVGVWKTANSNDPYWNPTGRQWEEYHVVVLPQDGSMCCLNEVYLDKNGIPHLSQESIGDNIWAGYPSYGGYHPEKSLEEGMAAYNWSYLGTEEAHGHPRTLVEGMTPMRDNRILYCESRHEKFLWNEDTQSVRKVRF